MREGSSSSTRAVPTAAARLCSGDGPPPLDEFDLPAVMGGPMGVHNQARYPWLAAEKRFLERALGAGKRVAGASIGRAQGDRLACGAGRGRDEDRARAGSGLPAEFAAFHWHADAFDLPPSALHLIESGCTRNQAFECGTELGLPCHGEATPQSVAAMAGHGAGETGGEPYSQTAAEVLAAPHWSSAWRRCSTAW